MIGRDLLEHVVNGKRDERVYLCEQEFALFALYYFSEFFTYRVAPFQWLMYKALNEFARGRFRFLLWVMFRESAKTSIAKMYVVYNICYRRKRFINWDSYDKGNAEAALFDIATWLQTNKKIVADFGQLFFDDPKQASRQMQMKRISEFVTVNKVKVKAYSTQEATRGRIYMQFRPDLYVLDDFETAKTVDSAAVTEKIVKHIDELKAGISTDGQVIFLGNFLAEGGIVGGLMEEAKLNPEAWRMQKVDVIDGDGNISWPDKYVLTNEEAAEANKTIPDQKQWKVSLEQKKKDLNAGGRRVYEVEMDNDPVSAGDAFFDRERVDAAVEAAKRRPPVRTVGLLSIWEDYDPRRTYAIGSDTSKGVGRDSCTSCVLRLKITDLNPAVIVGTAHSNTIAPDVWAYELKKEGDHFGECLIGPELNNTGFATVTQLKAIYKQTNIYRQVKKDQLGKVVSDDLGWEATGQNVADIYYQFRSAFEAGEVQVWCPVLLGEMRSFTNRDLKEQSRRSTTPSVGLTRHFDMLRAACIAWEMRHHARPPKKVPYKQQEQQKVSDYQG